MKALVTVVLSFLSLVATLGLVDLPHLSVHATSITSEDDSEKVSRQSLSSGFIVTPTELSVNLLPGSSLSLPLAVTRESSGTLGSCTGHFEITESEPISRALFETLVELTPTPNVAAVRLTLMSWADEDSDVIGDGALLHNGETGITDFTSANEPDFDRVVARFTNGVNDGIGVGWDYFDGGGNLVNVSGGFGDEVWAFQTGSDLVGYKVNVIRRDVRHLILQSEQAYLEVIWSVWGHPFFSHWLQFLPKSSDLAVGGSQIVSVTFSAVNMTPGVYTTSLRLDPGLTCGTPITIPVSMTIPEPCHPITGVVLNQMTAGTIFPSATVEFSATILPSLATQPFSFTVTQGAVMTSSNNPISFTWNFTNSGLNTTTISVWNCEMTMAEAVTNSVLSLISEPVVMHTVYLPVITRR